MLFRSHAISALHAMLKALDVTKGLGTWDIAGSGLFTTVSKLEKSDEVRDRADTAHRAMSRFQTELADVSFLEIPDLQLNEFTVFADSFFDGIFSNTLGNGQITVAQDSAIDALDVIEELVEELCAQLQESNMDKEHLEEERAELLTK